MAYRFDRGRSFWGRDEGVGVNPHFDVVDACYRALLVRREEVEVLEAGRNNTGKASILEDLFNNSFRHFWRYNAQARQQFLQLRRVLQPFASITRSLPVPVATHDFD